MSVNPRRLYRSRRDRQLAGVAAGMAEYLEIDPTLVRILWILSAFLGGFTILLYIIFAFVMPLDPAVMPAPAPDGGAETPQWTAPDQRPRTRGGRGGLVVGVGVVLIGVAIEACRLVARIERRRASLADPRPLRPHDCRPYGSGLRNLFLAVFVDVNRWGDVVFVVAEALANVAKHASAARCEIRCRREGEPETPRLVVEVWDNGAGGARVVPGGARVVPGGGLAGLAGRVEALDGSLVVKSPPRGPTTIRSEFPVGALLANVATVAAPG